MSFRTTGVLNNPVLNNPVLLDHSFFFRDPVFIGDASAKLQSDLLASFTNLLRFSRPQVCAPLYAARNQAPARLPRLLNNPAVLRIAGTVQ